MKQEPKHIYTTQENLTIVAIVILFFALMFVK